MGSVLAVLECAPGSTVHYHEAPCQKGSLLAEPAKGPKQERVCFDYAVVLSGRIEEYKAQGQNFPTTVKPGGFVTEHATLQNSWRDPCRIALVRLAAQS